MSLYLQTIDIDRRRHPWLLLAVGEVGILARCIMASHDANFASSYAIALGFAKNVVESLIIDRKSAEIPAAEILVESAKDSVRDVDAGLICTAWFPVGNEQHFCSCGTNTVVRVEYSETRAIVEPHSLALALNAQGRPTAEQSTDFIATHLLGKNCEIDDIRCASVRSDVKMTVVIAADPRLAREIVTSGRSGSLTESSIQTWLSSHHSGDHTHCFFYFRAD